MSDSGVTFLNVRINKLADRVKVLEDAHKGYKEMLETALKEVEFIRDQVVDLGARITFELGFSEDVDAGEEKVAKVGVDGKQMILPFGDGGDDERA